MSNVKSINTIKANRDTQKRRTTKFKILIQLHCIAAYYHLLSFKYKTVSGTLYFVSFTLELLIHLNNANHHLCK